MAQTPHSSRSPRTQEAHVGVYMAFDNRSSCPPCSVGRDGRHFDGDRRGHQHLVRDAREIAETLRAARLIAVTFDPPPAQVRFERQDGRVK